MTSVQNCEDSWVCGFEYGVVGSVAIYSRERINTGSGKKSLCDTSRKQCGRHNSVSVVNIHFVLKLLDLLQVYADRSLNPAKNIRQVRYSNLVHIRLTSFHSVQQGLFRQSHICMPAKHANRSSASPNDPTYCPRGAAQ